MVEELKLAIKIDDASIEQSLLKQFANAQKMADKVVLDFKNVNFDDKQIEAKFKEMQKKAGQNPIDLTIGGNTLDMLGQIDKRLTEIFSIGKGKSFIDSSSTVADIGKIENKINELNKKYEEAQKKISSIGSGNVSGKDINLVDNAEFQKLSDSFEKIKGEVDDLKTHMSLLDGSVVSGEQFIKLGEQVEGLSVKFDTLIDKYVELSNAQKALSSTSQESNISSGMKDAFQGVDTTASVEKTTQAIREENNALEETANKAKQAVSELVKSRDVVSQNWYREKGTVVGKDSKGNDITRDADEFSFVERLKNGQLQTVLATYNEETGKWAEQIINVRTAFEQVEKAIISADNKIASLEMTKEKTLAAHPGYDTTADDNQIAIERKKRDELQNTLNLYGQEKEYVFEIEAANKRIADNQERLNNKKQSQTNLRQAVSDEQFLKELNEAWNSATKVNNALNETNSLLNSLKIPNGFEGSFSTLESEIKRLNSEFGSGKISVTEYANDIKKAFSNYQTPIDNRSKDIWNELTTSLDRYATLQKRIASNNVLSTDNEEATKLLEHIHELQRNDILPTEKLTASNEKLQQINQTVTDLKAKLKESTLDSLQGSIDKYHKIYNQRSTYSSDFTPSEQYTKNLNELETAIGNLVEYKNTLKNVSEVTVEQEAELKRLVTVCEKASDSFKSLSASEKGASQIAVDKLVQRINKDLDECTNYSENAKHELMALREELESANPRNLKEITSEIINIENAEIRAGRAGRTLWDTMKHSGFHQIAAQMAGMVGVYDVINAGKEGINVVRELNTALTEMQKVSDETKQKLKDYQSTTFNTADAVGTTAKQIQNSTADWMRLGESMNQAAASAKDANILLNVSEFNNIDEATESLVSMSQAYKDLDKMDIIDVLNNVGNNYSISTDGLATALQDSASALVTANNDLNEAVALTTAGNAIPQDPSSVGAGMRTISLRLVGE